MPEYPIPPWIAQQAAPNPAAAYIASVHQGAQIGLEQQQMEQRRVLAEQELAARQAERQQRATLEQQQIEYEHARSQAELGLQQQHLDQEKQLSDIKIQQAGQQFAAQQRVQEAIASGVSPAEAMFKEAANLGMSAGDLGALGHMVNPPPELGGFRDEGGGYRSFQTGPNSRRLVAPPHSSQLRQATGEDGREIPGLYVTGGGATVRAPSAGKDQALAGQVYALKQKRRALQSRLNNKDLFAREVELTMEEFKKDSRSLKDQMWAKQYAETDINKRIHDIDQALGALGAQQQRGGAAGSQVISHRFIDGKIQPIGAGIGGPQSSIDDGESEQFLADASDTDPEEEET